MLYAERGNKVKQISENDIPRCLEQGYLIKNERGIVLHEAVPTDIPNLKLAFARHQKEIKALKDVIAKKDAEIKSLQQQLIQIASTPKQQVESTETVAPKKKSSKAAAKTEE